MFLKIEHLTVSQFMTAFPISVNSKVPFKTVVDFMSERGFGNILVTKRDKPIGVFTEREVLAHIVTKNADLETSVAEIGMQSFEIIAPEISVLDAAKIMISKKSRLLVYAESKLVGIITATDMLRAFAKTDNDPSIKPFISKNLAKCKSNISLKEAAKIMLDKHVGSLVVSNFTNYGIFTERDILHCLKEKVSLTNEIQQYCSWPLIKSEDTINTKGIARIMTANKIKRLGITCESNLVGVITAVDLIKAYQSSDSSHLSHWNEIK